MASETVATPNGDSHNASQPRQDCTSHRDHRAGRIIPDRVPARKRLRSPRPDSTILKLQHAENQPYLCGSPQCQQSSHEAPLTTLMPPPSAVGSTLSSQTRATTLLLSPTRLLRDPCNGILFNHEPPRRGENFVTRKITRALGRIKVGLQAKLFLGNIQASRDWGFSGEYVEAMWLMLQQEKPDDYVVATEESHTVEEFLEVSFGYVGLNWKDHVEIDKRYFRPTERLTI
ncbi:LOW QUALITY PROTEIN: hypothetical protein Bca4012_041632 [Brassica carinata]